jgi:hypothetical protein
MQIIFLKNYANKLIPSLAKATSTQDLGPVTINSLLARIAQLSKEKTMVPIKALALPEASPTVSYSPKQTPGTTTLSKHKSTLFSDATSATLRKK